MAPNILLRYPRKSLYQGFVEAFFVIARHYPITFVELLWGRIEGTISALKRVSTLQSCNVGEFGLKHVHWTLLHSTSVEKVKPAAIMATIQEKQKKTQTTNNKAQDQGCWKVWTLVGGVTPSRWNLHKVREGEGGGGRGCPLFFVVTLLFRRQCTEPPKNVCLRPMSSTKVKRIHFSTELRKSRVHQKLLY